jgi:hypothetical protein
LKDKIKRKLKILRMREQQAIKDMNFAECLRLEGAIFHIEDLYQYAMCAILTPAAPDSEGRSICDDGEAGCIACGINCGR